MLFLDGNPEQTLLLTVTLKVVKMVPEIMKIQVSESETQTETKEPTIVLNQNIQVWFLKVSLISIFYFRLTQ